MVQVKFQSTPYFDWWSEKTLLTLSNLTKLWRLYSFLDSVVYRLTRDFGFLPLTLRLRKKVKFQLLTGYSPFGYAGWKYPKDPYAEISISVLAAGKLGGEVEGFYFYTTAIHELVHIWLADAVPYGNWPWDRESSGLWQGSPFQQMVVTALSDEMNMPSIDHRNLFAPLTNLLYDLKTTYGWRIYQSAFSMLRIYLYSWIPYTEPLKSAIIILFLSAAARIDLLPRFRNAGLSISDSAYVEAKAKFPRVASLLPSPVPGVPSTPTVPSIPQVSIDKTTYFRGERCQCKGRGFTPNGTVMFGITIDNGTYLYGESAGKADSQGNISGSFAVGFNILRGQQKVGGYDFARSRYSNYISVTVL